MKNPKKERGMGPAALSLVKPGNSETQNKTTEVWGEKPGQHPGNTTTAPTSRKQWDPTVGKTGFWFRSIPQFKSRLYRLRDELGQGQSLLPWGAKFYHTSPLFPVQWESTMVLLANTQLSAYNWSVSGCSRSSFLQVSLFSCSEQELLWSQGAWASPCAGFSCCSCRPQSTQAFSSCSSQAQ